MKLDRNKINLLLDYYDVLLTDHQKDILSDYYRDDLSMKEIANNLQISKAAVSDLINRTINQLLDYENKLKLIQQQEKLDKIINELEKGDIKDKALKDKLIKIFRR